LTSSRGSSGITFEKNKIDSFSRLCLSFKDLFSKIKNVCPHPSVGSKLFSGDPKKFWAGPKLFVFQTCFWSGPK